MFAFIVQGSIHGSHWDDVTVMLEFGPGYGVPGGPDPVHVFSLFEEAVISHSDEEALPKRKCALIHLGPMALGHWPLAIGPSVGPSGPKTL